MRCGNGILQYYQITSYFVLPAIVLGVVCEKITSYFQNKFNLSPLVAIIFQLILVTLLLYIIEMCISYEYGSQLQSITAGIFFVSILFGLQVSLYTNIFTLAKNIGL